MQGSIRTIKRNRGIVGAKVLIGDHSQCLEVFRMPKEVFIDLLGELESKYDLHGSRSTSTREVLAMTLSVLGCKESNRTVCKRFERSGETVSRYFNKGLMALVRMSMDIITPVDLEFGESRLAVARGTSYLPYFKDCIGILDSTHVKARIPGNDQTTHVAKKEWPTQKIMATCDFNMCFSFVVTGCEGTTHDAKIFNQIIREPTYNFPMPPKGKYYLVSSRYPMRRGFLKPYKGSNLVPNFWPYVQFPHNYQGLFNQRHSSLHGIIKQAFGIWKKKWIVLQDMPTFTFEKQRLIVAATMALHNYIGRHHSQSDPDFRECAENVNFIPPEAQTDQVGNILMTQSGGDDGYDEYRDNGEVDGIEDEGGGIESMAQLRDQIAYELAKTSM
ncbi:hypothetical protein HPP92_002979 [Vanilla planifolia]|uniref:DDE Tnp4 domain-containing protein n=1 Tax=Vanilla planifolia TaxID=51239 RepID=A0A835S6J2_VANPL|nr:hypothetical protein HPP92_002979 [Vanilla planifolia]